jgi:hypothetical protein
VTRPRTIALLALMYLPLVAVVTVVGFAFGWQAPVGVVLVFVLFYVRVDADLRWPYSLYASRLRVALDLLVSAVIGSLSGALLFGGLGGIFGFAIAVIWMIGALPVTTKNAHGARVPLTLETSPATAKALTVLGFLLPVFLLAVCVLLLVAH